MMRTAAQVVSVVFHPLLMLTYMLLLMLLVNPYMFGYNELRDADALILMVFLTSALIPLIAILVMKGVGWVRSFQMPDKHERIGPYIVTAILYLTLYLHLAKAKAFPTPLLVSTLGTVIALFTGFVLNNFRKVSMHAMAAGGLLVMVWILYRSFSTETFLLTLPGLQDLHIPTRYLVYSVILIVGAICTARLVSQKHSRGEVYTGLVVGMMSLWLAWVILG